jgi:hypothetical protein
VKHIQQNIQIQGNGKEIEEIDINALDDRLERNVEDL